MYLELQEIDSLNEGIVYETYLLAEYTIPEVRAALKAGPVLLRFTKKTNGARRNMYCTTKMDMIPRDKWPNGNGSPSRDPNHIRVYDLVKKAWRSFIVGNIHPGKFKPGDIGFLDKVGMKVGHASDRAFEAPKMKPKPQAAAPKAPLKHDNLDDLEDNIPEDEDQSEDEEEVNLDEPKKEFKPFSNFMNWIRGRK